jgi:hypothetical protein
MKYLFLIATLLAAQALSPEVELNAEPHHHLILENQHVRVYNVEVPPHTDTLMHWHRHDYISINFAAEIVNAVKDKPPLTIKLEDGETKFSPAPFAHIVRNQTDQPFRNITVEIVDDESLRRSTPHWDEDRAFETFPGGTQQILFVKDAIRASEFELQPGAAVLKHDYTGPHLFVAVSDLDISSNVEGPRPIPITFKSGDCRWIPGGYSQTVTNVGKQSAKFITLEFPPQDR